MTDAPVPVTDPAPTAVPRGFRSHVANIGIKDTSLDFMLVVADGPCAAAGVFTQSLFAGPAIICSREVVADGAAQAVVTISKNANVANGPAGLDDARRIARATAEALGVPPGNIVQAATGVIGRRLPIERIETYLGDVESKLAPADFASVARAIMTTDTVPKLASTRVGEAAVLGVAKGVGMIEPDMATMLAFFFTDAAIDASRLKAIFRRVVDRTFNCVSIDTDTSTSDTAVILAGGAAGPVDEDAFETALHRVALDLTKAIARDGEGATKLIEVTVDRARDAAQAKEVAKLVVNSPLVKTAVHGSDPNWGRIAMAVGKAKQHTDIDPDRVVIRFGTYEVYPRPLDDTDLAQVEALLGADEVHIHVSLGTGEATATVWGCDLSSEYVHINADYTT